MVRPCGLEGVTIVRGHHAYDASTVAAMERYVEVVKGIKQRIQAMVG